ncbi:GTPase ObgE [Candidatus Gottesmanbacteria bacterium]|nr:GTPase ObgE [Candidatus Gottesmanbacteria bacterium]
MFIDEADVTFVAGHGGAGKASFYPGYKSGPDGGDGGNGGNIYICATSDLTTLNQFSSVKIKKAEDGYPGQRYRKSGKNGNNATILLPIGCELIDQDTNEIIEVNNTTHPILLCICKGGQGGRGTYALANPSNTTPIHAEPGQPGQKRRIHIELKLIADYGLIGLPNVGKSSLLNQLTAAKVRVAQYPFTTVEPNLGVMNGKIIADIPGLLEGASKGKGLGIKFLKHIEKVHILLHCISAESDDVVADYQIVRNELHSFNPMMDQKEEIIVLTKSDTVSDTVIKEKSSILSKFGEILPLSIHDFEKLQKLKEVLQ